MSNIDQAFINAYADRTVTPPPQSRGGYAVREPGPTLRVFAHAAEGAEHRIDGPQQAVSRHINEAGSSAYAEIAAQQQAGWSDADELTLPSRVGDSRPLSSFSAPKPTPSPAFKPVFEVDEFRWPAVTDELVASSRELLSPIAELLLAIAHEGRSLVGIGGANSRVGTTTIAICLARLIAGSGHSVALVDANFSKGDLAAAVGLEFDSGWKDVLAGKMPLAECAVASLADKITLIPLGGPAEPEIQRLASIQSSVIAGMLRYHHDIVLFDLGAASDPTQFAAISSLVEHCRLDAGLKVVTVGARDPITIHGNDKLSAAFGPLELGVIGNRAN